MKTDKPLIVTGLSGAGMSTALKHLEDFGYEVFDNFPLSLIPALLNDPAASNPRIAIGIDTRSRGFNAQALADAVENAQAHLLFLTADESELQKRFTETRRRHPLAKDRPVVAGIKKEQELLYSLRSIADTVIDTTGLSTRDLRRVLEGNFNALDRKSLTVTLMSFGYRYGVPREADIVIDVRFLSNPYWDRSLRPLNGLDEKVQSCIDSDPGFQPMIRRFTDFIAPLLPLYAAEGKTYLTVAFGCTGGRHRSVYTVETLKPWIAGQDVAAHIIHRDIER